MSRRSTLRGAFNLEWEKFTADSITLTVGTSSDTVADLQEDNDGNVYDLTEAAAAPGQDLIIDFINVPRFDRVHVLANYDGSANHSVAMKLFNWITSAWDFFDSMGGVEKSLADHGFSIRGQNDKYVGTGVNSGRVRVRLLHSIMGNVAHDTFIDEISLQRIF